MTYSVPDLWRQGTVDLLPDMTADHVVFSSPVADYRGRDTACHLLGLVPRTMERIETARHWADGNETVTAFTARVGDDPVQGMVHERRDASGRLEHVTLFLRPYRTLRVAIGRMKDLLDEHPLP